MRGGLIALSMLVGTIVSAGGALGALPHQQSTPGSNSIGIRLVDVPADSGGNSLGRSYIVDRVSPGTSIRRRVEISNNTDSTATVAVYPAAAALRRGRFAFAPGRSRNEVSSWTSLSSAVLRLPPGSKVFETVTINVPKKASAGERYAVVWAEVSAPAPAQGGVTLVNRVGVRMYLTIGPGGAPPANFSIGPVTAKRSAAGVAFVVANVHNSGRRTLAISGTLKLSKGPGGLRAGPFSVKLGTPLAPSGSRQATVLFGKRFPRGPWRAEMRLKSGFIQRVAVATIKFPRYPAVAKPHPAGGSPGGHRRLIGLGVILFALLGIVALSHFARLRLRPL